MIDQHTSYVLPRAPVDLVAVAVGGRQVLLAWSESGTGGIGFRVERADGVGPACLFSEIGRTGVYVSAFRDGSVKPRTTYSYRVHAWNDAGVSPPSEVVEVTIPRDETDRPTDRD